MIWDSLTLAGWNALDLALWDTLGDEPLGAVSTNTSVHATISGWVNHVYVTTTLNITSGPHRVILGSVSNTLVITAGSPLYLTNVSFETLLTITESIDAIPYSDISTELCLLLLVSAELTGSPILSLNLGLNSTFNAYNNKDISFNVESAESEVGLNIQANVLLQLTMTDNFSAPFISPDIELNIEVAVVGEVDRCQL